MEVWLDEVFGLFSENTDLVNPQFAHDNVVHGGGHFTPHIVVPARMELQVDGTYRTPNPEQRQMQGMLSTK